MNGQALHSWQTVNLNKKPAFETSLYHLTTHGSHMSSDCNRETSALWPQHEADPVAFKEQLTDKIPILRSLHIHPR